MARGADGLSYDQLLYIRRRFIYKEGLRAANARVIDAARRVRQPHIWGESSTALAGDSRQFATYGQNLHTEWHVRYQRKGVKIYWHVGDPGIKRYVVDDRDHLLALEKPETVAEHLIDFLA